MISFQRYDALLTSLIAGLEQIEDLQEVLDWPEAYLLVDGVISSEDGDKL